MAHRVVFFALICTALAACTPGASVVADSLRLAMGRADRDQVRLRPGLHYLRSETRDGHVAYLALGYVETDAQPPIEVWYSGEGQVLKLQEGRIVGTAGAPIDWVDVRLPVLPRWQEIMTSHEYVRARDVMPGYRANQQETLRIQPIAPPSASKLKRLEPARLRWFEEIVLEGEPLPPARFAIDDTGRVVYSEQCLSRALCFAFQPWAAE